MTVYRRNPLLMTVMGANPGANPGGPSFLVADSLTGQVMYTKRATGMGSEAINKCSEVAKKLAQKNRRSYIVFLDMSRARVGGSISVPWARVLGITEEVLPDGRVLRGNPPRRRKDPDSAIDAMIGAAWAKFMSGVQVSIMEIPKIFRDIKSEMSGGMTLEDAVRTVGSRYRVNRNPGIGQAIVGGIAGALASRAFQPNPHLEGDPCPTCSGSLAYQGTLGNREHYRCRNCGLDFNTPVTRERRSRGWRKTCGHGRITGRCELCRGRKVSSTVKPCPHGIAGGGVRCVACQRLYRRGGPVQNNPAIAKSWDGLKLRQRLAVLEFAGIDEDRAGYLSGKSWERLGAIDPRAQVMVTRGWSDSSSKTRDTGTRRMHETTVRMNPRGGKRRKMTLTVEQFAKWVKSKKNPTMWKAFLAKFKGYEKWTHGSRARKVNIEWIDTPGVDGLWITYDGGKQPESTYIMPKGSKRKGAWKHPWDTMPDIKHDPQAGIVITKLRGQSKITDFYHK